MLAEPELRERLMALPGMDRVLGALSDSSAERYLVGGAVRDLLLDRRPIDLDIAVEGDAEAVAVLLAEGLDGEAVTHRRFGTATVAAGGGPSLNLAQTRRETYAAPGALPEVAPAGLDEDLGRRDFTINALAAPLDPDRLGAVIDPRSGIEDLRAGLIRILHPASFVDDPTRLLRAVRYAARLGFSLEAETDRLAREAIATGALDTVSGPRIRDELLDLLGEDEAPGAVERLRDLALDRALHPALAADAERVASAKLAAGEVGADPVLCALAALCAVRQPGTDPARELADGLAGWVGRLGLAAADRDAVLRAARRGAELVAELKGELCASRLHALLAPEPPEALALALALGAPAKPISDYVSRLRGVELEISGDDLVAAGVPPSPALGSALAQTLARKLDGEIDSREDELRVALELARRDRP